MAKYKSPPRPKKNGKAAKRSKTRTLSKERLPNSELSNLRGALRSELRQIAARQPGVVGAEWPRVERIEEVEFIFVLRYYWRRLSLFRLLPDTSRSVTLTYTVGSEHAASTRSESSKSESLRVGVSLFQGRIGRMQISGHELGMTVGEQRSRSETLTFHNRADRDRVFAVWERIDELALRRYPGGDGLLSASNFLSRLVVDAVGHDGYENPMRAYFGWHDKKVPDSARRLRLSIQHLVTQADMAATSMATGIVDYTDRYLETDQ